MAACGCPTDVSALGGASAVAGVAGARVEAGGVGGGGVCDEPHEANSRKLTMNKTTLVWVLTLGTVRFQKSKITVIDLYLSKTE